MPIDLQTEEVLSLTDAAKAVPPIDGRRPHPITIWRWCRRGVRGVQLDYVRLGHRVCTSVEALARFARNLAEVDTIPEPKAKPNVPRKRANGARRRSIHRAEAVLAKARI